MSPSPLELTSSTTRGNEEMTEFATTPWLAAVREAIAAVLLLVTLGEQRQTNDGTAEERQHSATEGNAARGAVRSARTDPCGVILSSHHIVLSTHECSTQAAIVTRHDDR